MTKQNISYHLNLRFQQAIRTWLSASAFIDHLSEVLSARQFYLSADTHEDITWVNLKSGHQLRLDRYTKIETVVWERQVVYAKLDDLPNTLTGEYETFMEVIEELARRLPYPFVAVIPELQFGMSGKNIHEIKASLLPSVVSCHSRKNSGVRMEIDVVEDTPRSFDCLITPTNMEV